MGDVRQELEFCTPAVTEYLANLADSSTKKKQLSYAESTQIYDEWAETYEEDVISNGRYFGHILAADAMADYYSKELRPKIRILDVAAGTGMVGKELKKFGFELMDGLEPSSGMMRQLKLTNLYQSTYDLPIGIGITDEIVTDTYDSLVIAGGMGEGRIPVNALDEMIRIVKPQGTIFIVMREEYLTSVEEYHNLEEHMNQLEAQGHWTKVRRTWIETYSFQKPGILYVYKIN